MNGGIPQHHGPAQGWGETMDETNLIPGGGEEKRRYPRKSVSLPAFIVVPSSHAVHPATIKDISTGGVRLLAARESGVEARHFDPLDQLSLLFALPQEKAFMAMTCVTRRIRSSSDEIEVGALFTDYDLAGSEKLARFLRQ